MVAPPLSLPHPLARTASPPTSSLDPPRVRRGGTEPSPCARGGRRRLVGRGKEEIGGGRLEGERGADGGGDPPAPHDSRRADLAQRPSSSPCELWAPSPPPPLPSLIKLGRAVTKRHVDCLLAALLCRCRHRLLAALASEGITNVVTLTPRTHLLAASALLDSARLRDPRGSERGGERDPGRFVHLDPLAIGVGEQPGVEAVGVSAGVEGRLGPRGAGWRGVRASRRRGRSASATSGLSEREIGVARVSADGAGGRAHGWPMRRQGRQVARDASRTNATTKHRDGVVMQKKRPEELPFLNYERCFLTPLISEAMICMKNTTYTGYREVGVSGK
ncbi:hypothetical protein U9M48_010731 [Paspalum notatum var. saurae]|uniref:Uncharacterized protein n=1 Tax=Paspalum notatum var. saurae TaxID=547442 RepID=A0AAQ3STZ5_PASNO